MNERIEDLGAPASFTAFIRECLDRSCASAVPLTIEEYEHVRSQGNWFFLLPGHNVLGVEDLIEASDRYFIVGILGAGAEVAETLDRRQGGPVK
jgi:hypothetical protein